MGLYDTIKVEHDCPYCGFGLEEYQTKEIGSMLNKYKLGDSIDTDTLKIKEGRFSIKDYCDKCNELIEAWAVVENGVISKVVEDRDGLEKVVASLESKS